MSIHPSEISVMSGMTEDVTRQDLTDAQRYTWSLFNYKLEMCRKLLWKPICFVLFLSFKKCKIYTEMKAILCKRNVIGMMNNHCQMSIRTSVHNSLGELWAERTAGTSATDEGWWWGQNEGSKQGSSPDEENCSDEEFVSLHYTKCEEWRDWFFILTELVLYVVKKLKSRRWTT